jgi:hypothetical protein
MMAKEEEPHDDNYLHSGWMMIYYDEMEKEEGPYLPDSYSYESSLGYG